MYFRSAFLCAFILMLAPSAVHALTLKELQRYDKNGNGKLDAENRNPTHGLANSTSIMPTKTIPCLRSTT